MEGVDASLKTQLKEAATALLGRSLNVRSGETFRLSWSNLGNAVCEIGPKRPREKRAPHAHINLVDIPELPNAPRLELMLGVNNVLALQGEMIEVNLAGYPFIAEWDTPSGKVTLKGRDVD